MLRRGAEGGSYASMWWVWLPTLALLVAFEASFDAWFWRVPKVTGTNADYGYQFLVDARPLRQPAPEATARVVAFGSSVSGSFDPRQVEGLLRASAPERTVEVHRLLLPAAHPTDYALYFEHAESVDVDVAVILFNLVDFLFSGSDRDANPTMRYVLPPLPLLAERREHMSVPSQLDLVVAAASDVYRYRRPLRSAFQDNARAFARWLRSRPGVGTYGIEADGYTRRRFGLPLPTARPFELRFFVDPEWLRQRGTIRIRVEAEGGVVADRTVWNPGWQTLRVPPARRADAQLHVALDSTWSPRAAGADDLRLLGVRLAPEVMEDLELEGRPPFRYRPREAADIDTLLRMGGARGDEFQQRWRETLEADTRFGHRFRLYRDAKRAVADRAFEVDAEYAAIVRLAEHFVAAGAEVVLVNTPESPLMLADYEDSPYYDAYRGFFSDLAERLPSTRFVDLSETLEAEDFNDLHHPTFIGAIELGPVYASLVAEALRRAEP